MSLNGFGPSPLKINRAVVLLGPRRVGRTILVYHAIQDFLENQNISGRDILYVSLETPIYTGLSLENLIRCFQKLFLRPEGTQLYVFFDEIQYLKNWEVHLKSLVDTYRGIRFVATGSAAAALKTKSIESGAGRFTEFVLPPLTFAEYLRFIDREDELIRKMADKQRTPRYLDSKSGVKEMGGVEVEFSPSSLHCYTVARNTLEQRRAR